MKKQTKEVFINCPFDPDYQNHFNAIVFTLLFLDMEPRVAENKNAINDRISKIKSLVTDCQYSIHDLSRIEVNENSVPRFNMPFELGFDLGYAMKNKTKTILIFIHDISIMDDLISDLKGFDLSEHHNEVDEIIELIRNWLLHKVKTNANVPYNPKIYLTEKINKLKLYKKESPLINFMGFP